MNKTETGVLTLAYGTQKYIEMSKTLARSIKLHSPEISCAIVTDCYLEREINNLFDIVIPLRHEYGTNVRQKLYIDLYTPYLRTVFIDCDCISVKNINFIFAELKGSKFAVPGDDVFISKGDSDPFVDIDIVLSRFSLDKIPKFNGGLYYFEKGKETCAFFKDARSMLINSSQLGFKEFRGDGAADEPIVAVAMALHNFHIYNDFGRIMRTPIGIQGSLKLDVMNGISSFTKYGKHVSPAIVHFCGALNKTPQYLKASLLLKRHFHGRAKSTNSNHTFYEKETRYGFILYMVKYKLGVLIRLVAKKIMRQQSK